MRLLLSTDTAGGVWDYSLTLLRGLRAAGHPVMLAVLGDPGEDRLASLPAGVEVEARDYPLEWMPGAAPHLAPAGEWLAGLAHRWGAELVHLNQMAYAVHCFRAPTLVVVHSDVLSWFGETLGQTPGPEWDAYARAVRAGIAAADVLVTPSAYQSALCARHYGRGADRVIHNGEQPAAAACFCSARALLLSAGRAWDDAKGMGVLDRAVGRLGEAGPPAHLFGEEDGPAGQHFSAAHLAVHGRVEHGELERWLGRASLYVGASLYEPFGLAPLEAALRGCALVLSDIGSFRELWDGCARVLRAGRRRRRSRRRSRALDGDAALRERPGRRGARSRAGALRRPALHRRVPGVVRGDDARARRRDPSPSSRTERRPPGGASPSSAPGTRAPGDLSCA